MIPAAPKVDTFLKNHVLDDHIGRGRAVNLKCRWSQCPMSYTKRKKMVDEKLVPFSLATQWAG
jgi:hypothetical protein